MEKVSKEWKTTDSIQPVGRKQFLKMVLGVFSLSWAGMALYPVYRYLSSGNSDATSAESNVSSVTVCKVAELPVNTGKNFQFGSSPAIVIHAQDGSFHAFKAVCTHLGCTVQYRSDKSLIWCACHGGCYNPDTGKNVSGPPPKPLPALVVKVENDSIVVSLT